ncbi:YbaK/EbsC family protein [Nocardioides sp. GY 10127]|nr:YbaK/EbsC family protein [Nocardioides sp. GY 10127]
MLAAASELGLDVVVTRHGRVSSLAEAAAARGVTPDRLVKTMVVRLGGDTHWLVLVPGDRVIAWPALRRELGVSRAAMPPADEALAVTGFERGTITPLGTSTRLPVLADTRVSGVVSIGGGAHGVGITVDAEALLTAVDAVVADVTRGA